MLFYWLLFGYFAAGTVLSRDVRPGERRGPLLFILGSTLIAVGIGFRYKVGADWEAYEFLFSYARFADLDRVLRIGDPGYQVLNWAVQRIGGKLWLVNIVCGSIFAWGLHRFVRTQPEPWLAFVVALPYLVIVVAMGYSRQAVAIGILMAGLAAMQRGASVLRFALYVAVAALFHKTAVIVLPLVIFAGERSRILNLIAGIAGFILLYDIFLSPSIEGFVRSYIETEYSSQGALIRVIMNLIPALLLVQFRNRLQFEPGEKRLWLSFAIACLLMPLLLVVLPSSTVVDRLALYLIPIQIAVLPRIPYLFASKPFGRALIVSYAATVQFTWLNFAVHAAGWVPYRSYLF